MCGIAGYVGIEREGLLERMTAAIVHRGPDDEGHVHDGDAALGHRRLSIVDLAGGHQPMESPCGRFVIAFNGEIYNHRELRAALEAKGERFATGSDTEVLLRAFARDGERCLESLNGMFAFAVWDRRERELFLARDRVGIKPLYYADLGRSLLFASETKALLEYEGLPREQNLHALHDYLALRYVPGETCLFRAVRRLAPGHWLRHRDGRTTVERWWRAPRPVAWSARSEGELLEELGERLEASVRRRLMADVPFGAYLSGGLDSSLIVALMSRICSEPVKTFSVGFDYEHDELALAADTARLLGCDHREVACRAEDVALLPEVVRHSDEPLGDAISIPMFQLAREAKKEVTVILTGEGADELFGGYLFHKVMWAARLYRSLTPGPLREHLVKPLLKLSPSALLNGFFQYPAALGNRGKLKALDYLDVLETGSLDAGYRHLISLFDERDMRALYTDDFAAALAEQPPCWTPPTDSDGSAFDQMLRLQFGHWLPDNMLLRQDKMGMASAIEGRVPYLDHELIDFAFSLPRDLRLRGLTGKYLLRRLAERVLPAATARRKKMPFYVPVENYFEQPVFRDMVDDLLGEDSVRRRGVFRPEAIARLRGAMQRREFLLVKQVFSLMTLELWQRAFVDGQALGAPGERAAGGRSGRERAA